ncbi:MAG: murein biosynthesis integral membrane protein MurJ [Ktedonobacteraceae bacterium]
MITDIQTWPEEKPTASLEKKKPVLRQKAWGGRTFRFNLKNFLPGGNISLRRFSIVEAALLLMLALLASRGLGVLRQSIFNALFGAGPEANAYYAAARLPDTLFSLIAGGALTHAFIPVFLSHEKDHGKREAWRLTSLVFNVMLVILTVFILIGEFLTPTFVNTIIVPGYSPSEQALTASLTRIILVQPLILGLGTVITAVLNGKRQFLLPALSVAVYNIGLIGGLLVSIAVPKVGIYGPTYGIIAAAILQVGVQIPGLIKQKARYSFVWNLRDPGLREVMRLLGPNALAVGVASFGFIVDTAFVSYLPDKTSLAAIHNAQLLYQLPEALMAQAIGQALLPHIATQAAAGRFVRMRQTILKVMGASIVLAIPAALLLWLLGKPIIHLLFQHGAFTPHSSTLTNLAVTGYAVGLPGIIAGELVAGGFFALKDTRTPLFTNIFALAARYGLILLFLRLLHGLYIILAIPLALSGAATAEALLMCVLLLLRLRKKVTLDQGLTRLQRRRKYEEQQKRTLNAIIVEKDALKKSEGSNS